MEGEGPHHLLAVHAPESAHHDAAVSGAGEEARLRRELAARRVRVAEQRGARLGLLRRAERAARMAVRDSVLRITVAQRHAEVGLVREIHEQALAASRHRAVGEACLVVDMCHGLARRPRGAALAVAAPRGGADGARGVVHALRDVRADVAHVVVVRGGERRGRRVKADEHGHERLRRGLAALAAAEETKVQRVAGLRAHSGVRDGERAVVGAQEAVHVVAHEAPLRLAHHAHARYLCGLRARQHELHRGHIREALPGGRQLRVARQQRARVALADLAVSRRAVTAPGCTREEHTSAAAQHLNVHLKELRGLVRALHGRSTAAGGCGQLTFHQGDG